MSNKNVAIVRDIYAAFGRGDVPAIMNHFTFKNGKVVAWRGTEDTASTNAAYNAVGV